MTALGKRRSPQKITRTLGPHAQCRKGTKIRPRVGSQCDVRGSSLTACVWYECVLSFALLPLSNFFYTILLETKPDHRDTPLREKSQLDRQRVSTYSLTAEDSSHLVSCTRAWGDLLPSWKIFNIYTKTYLLLFKTCISSKQPGNWPERKFKEVTLQQARPTRCSERAWRRRNFFTQGRPQCTWQLVPPCARHTQSSDKVVSRAERLNCPWRIAAMVA